MHINLPSDVKRILNILNQAGYEAFAVGGCVRDSVLGITPYDWDITTSADPYAVKALFLHTVDTGLKHGTVTVLMNHVGYEVTTYRIDGEYKDARHPEKVIFTKNLEEDLKRRDFTINAMAYNDEAGLIDLFGGVYDLKSGIIKCVGDPEKRFTEDALRILRAFRFAARFGFEIDEGTVTAARKIAENIKKVSIERIREELNKILLSDNPDMLIKAYETGVTDKFIPEFDCVPDKISLCRMIKSAGSGYRKKYPDASNKDILILKWAVLAAYCAGEETSLSDKLDMFLNRFKFDNYSKHSVKTLAEYVFHDMTGFDATDMRILMSEIGADLCPMLFELKRVIEAENALNEYENLTRLYDEIIKNNDCTCIADLSVTGRDLINAGVSAGPMVGITLKNLLNEVMKNPCLNNKEDLLKIAKSGIKS